MGGLDAVYRPLSHRRKPSRQRIGGDKFVDRLPAIDARDKPTTIPRHHRVRRQIVFWDMVLINLARANRF